MSEQRPERRWIAFYRMTGPTMEHLFVGDSTTSICRHMNRDGQREWSKQQPRCARCEKMDRQS